METIPDPVAAVGSAYPARTYAALAAREPLVWHPGTGTWLAVRPDVVREVLDHPDCGVRPPDVPVPPALEGTTAGCVFARLARMTEGEPHARAKRAITGALADLDQRMVTTHASRTTSVALASSKAERIVFDIPLLAVAGLLGVPERRFEDVRHWAGAFAQSLAPGATDDVVAAGIAAAEPLWSLMSETLGSANDPVLAAALARRFVEAGVEDSTNVIANMIGLMFQAHDAVAGLLGNAVVHASRTPDALAESPRAMVEAVAFREPAIQNTRRFVARDTQVAGVEVHRGDAILVVLASPRDDGAGACPFGHGRHVCPGQEVALGIATAALGELRDRNLVPLDHLDGIAYLASANARIPVIGRALAPAMQERPR